MKNPSISPHILSLSCFVLWYRMLMEFPGWWYNNTKWSNSSLIIEIRVFWFFCSLVSPVECDSGFHLRTSKSNVDVALRVCLSQSNERGDRRREGKWRVVSFVIRWIQRTSLHLPLIMSLCYSSFLSDGSHCCLLLNAPTNHLLSHPTASVPVFVFYFDKLILLLRHSCLHLPLPLIPLLVLIRPVPWLPS